MNSKSLFSLGIFSTISLFTFLPETFAGVTCRTDSYGTTRYINEQKFRTDSYGTTRRSNGTTCELIVMANIGAINSQID